MGGFPEPLLRGDEREHRIWQRERVTRVVREDLRDLERVREISLVEHLVEMLPARVGSPLSIRSLREDLSVDHKTVERWLVILENLYLCFRILPYASPKVRAVKNEGKLYLWDWSSVRDDGPRFENMVACQLLKYCHFVEDTEGHAMELRYLRDVDRREVDFVVLRDGATEFAVERKSGERALAPVVSSYAACTPIPRLYQVHLGQRHFEKGPCMVVPLEVFCREPELP